MRSLRRGQRQVLESCILSLALSFGLLACSSDKAADPTPWGTEPEPLVEVIFRYDAPGYGEALAALTRAQGTDRYQQALDDVYATLEPIIAVLQPELEPHCTVKLSFLRTMPVGICDTTETGAAVVSTLDQIRVETQKRVGDTAIASYSHSPSDEHISFSFNDLVYPHQTLYGGLRTRPIKFGLIEYSGCDSHGDPWRVDDTVYALKYATIHHLNDSQRVFSQTPHAHAVTTVLSHFNEPNTTHDIFPFAEFYVANIAVNTFEQTCKPAHKKTLYQALEWFRVNGVRLINRSTFQTRPFDGCRAPLWEDERLLDEYVRLSDAVVTSAAGQVDDIDDANCGVMCDAQNQTCVGAAIDLNHANINSSANQLDDRFPEEHDGIYFLYRDPEEQDREEPDVVAPAVNVVHSIVGSDSMTFGVGTSAASPLVLGLLAGQLETISDAGDNNWTNCRVSEFMRAAVKFASHAHPVDDSAALKRTAAHDHMTSGNPAGLNVGDVCMIPDDCQMGTTCLWGRCAPNPGDERVGWGMASAFNEILSGNWTCPRNAGNGECGISDDGTCRSRTKPSNAVDPQEFGAPPVTPPPNKLEIAPKGYQVATQHLTLDDIYRGVLTWSSCPVGESHGAPACSSDDDCPQFSQCLPGFGTCQGAHSNRRQIPAVDFDVAVQDPSGNLTWLSYSLDDTSEAFEYTVPVTGNYTFWAFPTKVDWDCDESAFGGQNVDGEFLYFIGRVLP